MKSTPYQAEHDAYLNELNTLMQVFRVEGKTPREAADLAFTQTKHLRLRLRDLLHDADGKPDIRQE